MKNIEIFIEKGNGNIYHADWRAKGEDGTYLEGGYPPDEKYAECFETERGIFEALATLSVDTAIARLLDGQEDKADE